MEDRPRGDGDVEFEVRHAIAPSVIEDSVSGDADCAAGRVLAVPRREKRINPMVAVRRLRARGVHGRRVALQRAEIAAINNAG